MTRLKRILMPLFACVFCICLSLGVVFSIPNKASVKANWTGSGYTKTESGSDVIFASNGDLGAVNRINYSSTTGTNNAISFSVNFLSGGTEATRNLAFWAQSSTSTNEQALFKIMPANNSVSIIRELNDVSTVVAEANYTASTWVDFKIVFQQNYFGVYVNNTLQTETFNTFGNKFENTSVWFTSWGVNVQVKNITLSYVTVATTNGGEWQNGSAYSKTTVNGEDVYTVNYVAGAAKSMAYSGTTGNANTFSFDVKHNLTGTQDERNAGFIVYANNSSAYMFFEIMPYKNEARIRIINGNNYNYIASASYGQTANDTYLSMECVFESDYAGIFINGKLICCRFGELGYTFNDTTIKLSSWDNKPSFKNMRLSVTNKTDIEKGYADFDFTTATSMAAITATNANVSYDANKQAVNCAITSASHNIDILVSQPRGSKYSMYLPIRNTFLFRIKNATSATNMQIQFQTTFGGNTWYSKNKAIQANSDFTTYMCNVSDLNADGYLSKIRLVFTGASSGTVSIDGISFEREDPYYNYAAETLSCTATNSTVTVSGKLSSSYANKTITIYSIEPENVEDDLAFWSNKSVATGTANSSGNFTITFPFIQANSNMNHLSSIFLAGVNGVKLAKSFQIENLDDFITNPYAFSLPNRSVKVTDAPYNAKGDGFTNDNDAIQAAIDYISGQGGGTVIIPGSNTEFGNRFIATNIRLKDNVELRIEKGAMIWQSPRISDYPYEVLIGHDYVSDDMWPHACNVNIPLILSRNISNVKITGGGSVRMMDWGGEAKWAWDVIDPNQGAACGSTIHLSPVYNMNVTNLEISNINILRTNNWNLSICHCDKVMVKNIYFGGVNCKNGDGVGMTNSSNLFICRNRTFTADDSFTINAIPEDPRCFSDWKKLPTDKNYWATHNVELCYNNMRGGLGLVFVPWGTHLPDSSTVEIKNVVGYNNVFAGFGQSIGSWTDNPFYGWSSGKNYNFMDGEKDDSSPIKDVYLYDNIYYNNKELMGVADFPVGPAKVVNFNSTSQVANSTQFVNASFERDLRYDNEVDWVSGLSYWTEIVESNGAVGYEQKGTKTSVAKYTSNSFTVKDYAGYIKGNAKLYQGLYLNANTTYKLTMTLKNVSGTANMFVGTPVMKKHVQEANAVNILSSRVVANSNGFTTCTYTFTTGSAGVYALGLEHSGDSNSIVYLDDASVVVASSTDSLNSAREQLSAQIEIAKACYNGGYNVNEINSLKEVVASAEAVLNNSSSTISNLNTARQNVANAVSNLSTCNHTWDNPCDTACNLCGYTRETTHTPKTEYKYNNFGHWHECRYCSSGTTLELHSYDDANDATCECGFTRVINNQNSSSSFSSENIESSSNSSQEEISSAQSNASDITSEPSQSEQPSSSQEQNNSQQTITTGGCGASVNGSIYIILPLLFFAVAILVKKAKKQ